MFKLKIKNITKKFLSLQVKKIFSKLKTIVPQNRQMFKIYSNKQNHYSHVVPSNHFGTRKRIGKNVKLHPIKI